MLENKEFVIHLIWGLKNTPFREVISENLNTQEELIGFFTSISQGGPQANADKSQSEGAICEAH